MKAILFALFIAMLMVGCGGDSNKPVGDSPESKQSSVESSGPEIGAINLDDNKTRKKIMALAIDGDQLEQRGAAEEKLFYAPGQAEPFTGWAKWADGKGGRLIEGMRLQGYKRGREHGVQTKWYKNGQKLYQLPFKYGKMEGIASWWWKNGQKKAESTFREGKRDGLSVSWHEDGKKKEEATYRDGKYHGLKTEWRANGHKKLERSYRQGKLNGVAVNFREDGSVSSRTTWEDGKRDETKTILVRPPKKFPLSPEETKQWAEWEANPEPYGGLDALAMIREVKERGEKKLDLSAFDRPPLNITDLAPLALLQDLEDLDLRSNLITDLSPLSGLVKLQSLYLSDNRITELKPLTTLTNLRTLRLSFNPITDVKPLAKLTKLSDLWLMGAQVSDATPLMGLTTLGELNLRDNPLPEDQKASIRKAFRHIFSLFLN